jgi:hypothetical protein
MRCYLIKKGSIVASEEYLDLSKEEAIARCRALFREAASLDGFEIWDQNRKIHREGFTRRTRRLS